MSCKGNEQAGERAFEESLSLHIPDDVATNYFYDRN